LVAGKSAEPQHQIPEILGIPPVTRNSGLLGSGHPGSGQPRLIGVAEDQKSKIYVGVFVVLLPEHHSKFAVTFFFWI
jgi:hypothetical protein